MREDWIEVELEQVGEVVSGGTPKTSVPEFWGSEISWVTPADLSGYEKKYISKGRKSITREGLQKSSAKLIPKNSVLFSSRAPIGYVVIAKNELSTNQGFKSLIPYKILFPEYIYYQLKASKNTAEKYASGTTFKELSATAFSKLPFKLAPLPEQRAIVAKIEQLFSELDNGIANLKTAKKKLEIYRQAVLKKAFEGGFTDASIEWEEKFLKDIIKISSGTGLAKAGRDDTGRYLVYGGNGVIGRHGEYMFEERQLIIGRVGVHCGNVHITDSRSWITDNAFVVYFDKADITLTCLYYLLLSLSLNQYASSTAQPVISGGRIYPVKFLFPPREIQEILVHEIETRLSVCDNILANIEEGLEKAEALRQSILKKAFEGRLLSKEELEACRREPDWEPAEKLLERIKQERKEEVKK